MKPTKKNAWNIFSKYMRAKHPYCQLCGKNAQCVHHIVKKSRGNSIYFDEKNCIVLCDSCHYKIHYVWDCYENCTWIGRHIGATEYYKLKIGSKKTVKYGKCDYADMIDKYKKLLKELKDETYKIPMV
jgi:hypothetical protein